MSSHHAGYINKFMNKLYIILSLLFSIAFVTSRAQNNNVLTYQQAIEAALKNNFDIQIAGNNAEISKTQNTYGNAGFLPRVDLNASGTLASNDTKQEFSNGTTVDKNGVSSSGISAGVYLNWTIFDGLRMFAAKERLNLSEESGQLNLKLQIENTIQQVTLAYFQIVKQEQLIKGINSAKAVSEERIKIAEKKQALGSGSNVELLQAKLDLNAQKANLIIQKNLLEEFKGDLLILLKNDPFSSFTVDSVFTFGNIQSAEEIKTNIEKTNTSILLAQKNILISNQYIKELRSEHLPKLAVNAAYQYGRNQTAAGFALYNRNQGASAGFTFTWNIFNGLNTSNQIKAAKLELENNNLYAESTKYILFSGANVAYRRWLGDKEMLALEEENIKLAEESMHITTERLRLGLGNYLEIKESQKSYEEAITRLVNARYNLKASETGLRKMTGELLK
ncbi:MAG: TolC family protein [Bacteroidota bacterium]|jgi:outer membrane protein TolC|nr:TolC family protein [Bacteroidota bacterium]